MSRPFAAGLLLAVSVSPALAGPFRVAPAEDSPSPPNGADGVSHRAVVRISFTSPLEPATLTPQAMYLSGPKGERVPGYLQTDLTGGVATLAPTLGLSPGTRYTLHLTARLRSRAGVPLEPFSSSFTTAKDRPRPRPAFIYRRELLAARDSNSCLSVGPDGHLYVANTYGELRRYRLDPKTGKRVGEDVPYESEGDQIVGMAWDPEATAEKLLMWISFARYGGNYSGTVARLTLPPVGSKEKAHRADYITGLPHDDLLHHQPNGIAFGPDGRLYQSVGGVATLGGTPNWGMKETPLSAAVLVADVRSPGFNGGKLPCDVRTADPIRYDPFAAKAPVRIFATGFRNAYDLCWHSSGHLFTATNQNSIADGPRTPASPHGKVPAINARPREMLFRVVEGRSYGHPNPSRREYVLNGGNPTRGVDPFEVPEYPLGVKPPRSFDPALIYDLRPGGGNSANGMTEHPGPGPLRGRLLIAYFSGSKGVQAFAFDKAGRVTDEHPLTDKAGNVHRFRGAIDVAVDPRSGRVYVADFGEWKRPHHGKEGGVYVLEAVRGPG